MYPSIIVPTMPTIVPAFLNAAGMAKIPEPSDDFRRFANDLTSLERKDILEVDDKTIDHVKYVANSN